MYIVKLKKNGIYVFLIQIWFGECNQLLLKVKISCCVCGEFLTFNAYQLNLSYQIWVGSIFVYQKSLKQTFKPVFEYKIIFWIFVLVLWIHKGYYVVKKLMWNVRIKAFWYTKIITYPKKIWFQKSNIKKYCFLCEKNCPWKINIANIIKSQVFVQFLVKK